MEKTNCVPQVEEIGVVLARLREKGWMVAAHNDYRSGESFFTFWLLIHRNGRYLKGEGKNDDSVLAEIERRASALEICSFCAKSRREIRKLIAAPDYGVYICDECVGICIDVLRDDAKRGCDPGKSEG